MGSNQAPSDGFEKLPQDIISNSKIYNIIHHIFFI